MLWKIFKGFDVLRRPQWTSNKLKSCDKKKVWSRPQNRRDELDFSQTGVLFDQAAAWFQSGSQQINQAVPDFNQAAAW